MTFWNNENVTEITIPASVIGLHGTFCGASNLAKVTISAGSKLTGDGAFASDMIFNTGAPLGADNFNLLVYCEKAVAKAIESWEHVGIIVYSLDGKTVYYDHS